jgi:hypothetical protein
MREKKQVDAKRLETVRRDFKGEPLLVEEVVELLERRN